MSHAELTTECGDSLPSVLVKLGRLIEKRMQAALAGSGISAAQYIALNYLAGHPNSSRADLSRGIKITPQAAGGIVDKLVAKGLVSRTPFTSGTRIEAALTGRGQQVLEEAAPVVDAIARDILRMFRPAHGAFLDAAPRHLLAKLDYQ